VADLLSVHGFHCYDSIHVCKPYILQMRIVPNAKYQRVLVLAIWLVLNIIRGGICCELAMLHFVL